MNEQKNVSAAFVKAQKAFAPAIKSSTNPHYRSTYVDLAGCIDAVLDALNANGIGLIQKTVEAGEKGVSVETIFVHESGETMSGGILYVPVEKINAQGFGSALTYARRYSLMAACGIAPEDDDGNAASKAAPKHKPVVAALDGITINEEDQAWLRELAEEIKSRFQTDQRGAFVYMTDQRLDADQKLYLWNLLDSKVRAEFKRLGKQNSSGFELRPTMS